MKHTPAPTARRRQTAARSVIALLLAAGAFAALTRRAPAQDAEAGSAPAPAIAAAPEGIRLNFRGAQLSEVLDYLSEAAGFVIIQDSVPQGEITVVSHQPLSADEAADLLISILHEKGYGAVRNGRILKIVPLSLAHQQYLPVQSGADPEAIRRSDELVTQIIPVRYVAATELLANLQPLMAENTKLSANESSNSLVMTDTMSNIRRTVEIIRALDTSIADISTLQVFPLQYADATEMAEVISGLFEDTSRNTAANQRGGRGGGPAAMFERMQRGGGDGGQTSVGEAQERQAAFRVVAVADERSNSLVVAAPAEVMPTIQELVAQMDTNVEDISEVRVFPLQNADAMELAQVLTGLYEEAQESSQQNTRGPGFGGPFSRQPGQRGGAAETDSSSRSLQQTKVVAVGDPRTNSLIVSAARESMMQIAELVGRLDSSASKRERVYVYPLQHADVDNVAAILRGMFDANASTTTRTQAENPLTTRTTTGASTDLGNEFGRTGGNR